MLEIWKWSGRRAANELARRGKRLAEGKRSKSELYRVLTLTVGIVSEWNSKRGRAKIKRRRAELIGLLENRSGAKGGLEHYLLRAAFGCDPARRRSITAWAQACMNVASHMREAEIPFSRKNVRKTFEEFGVQRARLNEFGKRHSKQRRCQQARDEEDW